MHHIPLLLGGSGRSGTTILAKLIAAHPDLTETPESRFLVDPHGVFDILRNYNHFSPYSSHENLTKFFDLLYSCSYSNIFHRNISKLETYFRLRNLKVSPRYAELAITKYAPHFEQNIAELRSKLVRDHVNFKWVGQKSGFNSTQMLSANVNIEEVLRDFMQSYFQDVINNQGVKFYFEKNTWNILYLDDIFQLWPNAKLVIINRHPIRVIESFSRQLWMPVNINTCAEIYVGLMNKYFSRREKYFDNILEVKYEDLIAHTSEQMQIIYDHYSLDYSENWCNVDIKRGQNKMNLSRETIKELLSVSGLVDVCENLNYVINDY